MSRFFRVSADNHPHMGSHMVCKSRQAVLGTQNRKLVRHVQGELLECRFAARNKGI
jgi:hypothetical protein